MADPDKKLNLENSPCPFCGKRRIMILGWPTRYCAFCQDCLAKGGTAKTKAGAALNWKMRAGMDLSRLARSERPAR